MHTFQNITLFLFLSLISNINGQTFEKTYTGQWAMTFWNFEFHKDSSYKKTSSGHFGNTIFTGKYSVQNDTIELLNGYENSSGTLNKYYLISDDYNISETKPSGRIIDLTNLYEYYENNLFNLSKKNKHIFVTITDSLNNIIHSYQSYIPIDPLSNQINIDLGWCVTFYNFPINLNRAKLIKPNNQYICLDYCQFNNQQMLSEYYYIGSMISGIKPETMQLEYFNETKNVKKITDSKNGSYYIFQYDENNGIIFIDYLTINHKKIAQLKIMNE